MRLRAQPIVDFARIAWDIKQRPIGQYEKYWVDRQLELIPRAIFERPEPIWFEVGAGSGSFFVNLAGLHPDRFLVAIERSRMRGNRLVRKAARSGLPNLAAFRGNAIPPLVHGIPTERVERVYLLYPAPWPKISQRKNRWYVHPIMPHLVRILKKGGLLIWASDQRFYIDEAHFVCSRIFGMETLHYGALSPNPYNELERFPGGRTKFEASFLAEGQACHELIVRKPFS